MDNEHYSYTLEMETPLGKRQGRLELDLQGASVDGLLTMFTRTTPIQDGSHRGNRIAFRGEMRTLMGPLSYQAEGLLLSNGLSLEMITEQGRYPTRGILTRKGRD